MKPVSQSTNDSILRRLQASRRAVLKFLNNAKPFKLMTLKAVKRECRIGPNGFTLRVTGDVLAMDPTVGRWLLQQPWPAFRLKSEGMYHKQLDDWTTMVLFNAGANMPLRWHIGYEIKVPMVPSLPKEQPTKADLESYVLRQWEKELQTSRTHEWHRRQL